jgi:hypothetical protein
VNIALSRVHLVPGILVVHAVMALILLALFYRQLSVTPLRRMLSLRWLK